MSNVALGMIMLALAALLYQPAGTPLAKRINSASNAAIAAAMVVCGAVLILREVTR